MVKESENDTGRKLNEMKWDVVICDEEEWNDD